MSWKVDKAEKKAWLVLATIKISMTAKIKSDLYSIFS